MILPSHLFAIFVFVLIAAREAFARKASVAQRVKRLVLPRPSTRGLLTMLSRQPRRSAHEA
jgi:hypothetical protein